MIASLVAKSFLRSSIIRYPLINSNLPIISTTASSPLRSYSTTIPYSSATISGPTDALSIPNKEDSTDVSKRKLPRNVCFVVGRSNSYKGTFVFMSQRVSVGYYSTPDEASAAVQSKRFELQSNPTLSIEAKPDRGLPHGVSLHKTNRKNPYKVQYHYNGEPKYLGCYPTPESASKAYVEKMAELRLAMPKEERDFLDGVSKDKRNGKYFGKFHFHSKTIRTLYFSTPELAFEALQKRRAECLADPEVALKLKPPRDLPVGVKRVSTSKKEKGRAMYSYQAYLTFEKKGIWIGSYSTPQLAFEELNKKRESLGIQIGLWDWAHTKLF